MEIDDGGRRGLRRIIRTVLDEPTLWPTDGRAAGLRQELERLLQRVAALDPATSLDYAFAIALLSRHMPDDINRLYRGDLAQIVNVAAELSVIQREHPSWNEEAAFDHWHATHGEPGTI